jgi:Na+-driven multidrug efflux pump
MIAFLSLCFIAILTTASESLIYLFVDNHSSSETVALALEFTTYVWPLFLFVGFNMMISGYLTAAHLPFQSAIVALSRGLILPTGFLILFYNLLSNYRFISALAISEGITFILAVTLFFHYNPEKAISREM